MRLGAGCVSGVAFLQNIIAAHGYTVQHLVNDRRGGGARKQKRGLNFKTGGSLSFPDTGTKGRELQRHGRKKNANAPASAQLQKVTQGKRKHEEKERKQTESVSAGVLPSSWTGGGGVPGQSSSLNEKDARIFELESQVRELTQELAKKEQECDNDAEDRDEPVIAAVRNFDHTGLGSQQLLPQDVMALTPNMVPNVKLSDVDPDGNEWSLAFPPKRKFVTRAQPFYLVLDKLSGEPYLKERHRDSTGRLDYRGWAVTGPHDYLRWGAYGCEDQSSDCRLLLWKDFKSGEIMSADDCIDLVKTRKQLLVSAVPKERHSKTISLENHHTLTHELGYAPLQFWFWGATAGSLSLEKMIESSYLKLTCYKWQPPGLHHKGPFHMVKTVMLDTEGKTLGVRLWLSAEPAKNDIPGMR
eukprot:g16892.t1